MGYGNITVTTSATKIVSANPKRQSIIIENEGSETVYIGPDSSVTSANGIALEVDGNLTEDAGGTRMFKGDIWGITSANTADVRYWEREGNI